jgi:hypothetical protein
VTLIEPGGFSTDWAGPSAVRSAEHPAYADARAADRARRGGTKRGNPSSTSPAIFKVVDADKPPLRIFLGRTPLSTAEADYESRLATWREWQDVAVAAQGED